MVLGIVMIMIAGAVGWWYLGQMNPEGAAGDVQSFTVLETDDLDSISERLLEQGLISDVGVFDVFTGKGVPEGKKSLAIEVTLQPRDKTLTDAEIEAVAAKVVAAVKKATGGELRG